MEQPQELKNILATLQEGVTELDLSDYSLSESDILSLADALIQSQTLKRLDLSNIPISEESAIALAKLLAANTPLADLLLCNCQITDVCVKTLAGVLTQNRSLIVLDLSQNQIGDEGAIALAHSPSSSLTGLYLYTNLIGNPGALAWANALGSNKTLRTLDLYDNPFSEEGAISLINALNLNETVVELILTEDNIQGELRDTWNRFLERNRRFDENNESQSLGLEKTLKPVQEGGRSLYINDRILNEYCAMALTSVLASSKTLQHLSLTANYISDAAAIALSKALASNDSLQSLTLGGNRMTSICASTLVRALSSNKSLELLAIIYQDIDTFIEALTETIPSCRNLAMLILDHAPISEASASMLAKALESSERLEGLSLEDNQMSETSIRTLMTALSRNKDLRALSMSKNPLSQAAAQTLVELLKNSAHMERVVLTQNRIQDADAVAIAKALASSSNLIELDLRHNLITNTGAIALAGLLRSHKNLKLNLTFNELGDEAMIALTNAVIATGQTELDLNTNRIGDQGVIALAKILSTDDTIKSVDLSWNPITDASVRALIGALASNTTITRLSVDPSRIEDPKLDQGLQDEMDSLLQRNHDYDLVLGEINSAYHIINIGNFSEENLNIISDNLKKADDIMKKQMALGSAYANKLECLIKAVRGIALLRTGKILECLEIYSQLQPQPPNVISLAIAMMLQADQPFEDKRKTAALIFMLLRGVPDSSTLQFFALQELSGKEKTFKPSQSLADFLDVDRIITLVESPNSTSQKTAITRDTETCAFYEEIALSPENPLIQKVLEGEAPPRGDLESRFETSKRDLLNSLKSQYTGKAIAERAIKRLSLPATAPEAKGEENAEITETVSQNLQICKETLLRSLPEQPDQETLQSINSIIAATSALVNNLHPETIKEALIEYRKKIPVAHEEVKGFFNAKPLRPEHSAALFLAKAIEECFAKFIKGSSPELK